MYTKIRRAYTDVEFAKAHFELQRERAQYWGDQHTEIDWMRDRLDSCEIDRKAETDPKQKKQWAELSTYMAHEIGLLSQEIYTKLQEQRNKRNCYGHRTKS